MNKFVPGRLKRSVVARMCTLALALALLVTAIPVQPLSHPAQQPNNQAIWITPDWVNWNS